MGRLPATFAGRQITMRSPWVLAGEVILTSGQANGPFPDNTFINNTDRPFEVHRMIPRVTALDSSGVGLTTPPDQFGSLLNLIRTYINDLDKNNPFMKAPTLLRTLVKGSSELTWEWAEPYYVTKGAQLQVQNQALTFPAIGSLSSLRFELGFEGFFVTLAPPSEGR